MRRGIWYLATAKGKDPELNHRPPMMPHIHYGASESFWVSGALTLATLIYLRGWLRLHKHEHGKIEGWRAGSFLFGLLLIWIATASPLAALDHEMLTAHMVQHLLLMTLAPPLILFGMPRKPLASVLAHPALCWLAAAGTLVVWHIPTVFMLGMRSQIWHGVEQASFLATGLLFWWPVIQPLPKSLKWPESSILLYLFLATLPCDILSGFLVFCDRVVYPVFLSSPRSFGLSALEDQQFAGALMWTCVTIVYLIAGALFTIRLLSPHRSYGRTEDRLEELAIPQFVPPSIPVQQPDRHSIGAV
jgi:cytochrome c oxidase assembly factor CtaG